MIYAVLGTEPRAFFMLSKDVPTGLHPLPSNTLPNFSKLPTTFKVVVLKEITVLNFRSFLNPFSPLDVAVLLVISWFLSIYSIICCSEALVSFRPLHVFQQWLLASECFFHLKFSLFFSLSCVELPSESAYITDWIVSLPSYEKHSDCPHSTKKEASSSWDFEELSRDDILPGRQRHVQNKPCWWLGKGLSGFVESCSNLLSILSHFCRPSHTLLSI